MILELKIWCENCCCAPSTSEATDETADLAPPKSPLTSSAILAGDFGCVAGKIEMLVEKWER